MKTMPVVSHTILQDPYTKEYHININIRVKTAEEIPVLSLSDLPKASSLDSFLQSVPTNFNKPSLLTEHWKEDRLLSSLSSKALPFLTAADGDCLKTNHLSPHSYL